ncbi:hypothetical protein RFI_26667 [Reticulomyxa filosa]|uniref:Uncharacterized protein n=1 Tax=Reticulomyxa filosa TaxID=46433 RepID=X6M9Y5_RETFI|nr:hypothetical protein RFI_26667 [Reticulomyxa filosa]|eukprot:ETO10709.1 hypothetical protein RFI_26667 [Reticulomyxa filosa]
MDADNDTMDKFSNYTKSVTRGFQQEMIGEKERNRVEKLFCFVLVFSIEEILCGFILLCKIFLILIRQFSLNDINISTRLVNARMCAFSKEVTRFQAAIFIVFHEKKDPLLTKKKGNTANEARGDANEKRDERQKKALQEQTQMSESDSDDYEKERDDVTSSSKSNEAFDVEMKERHPSSSSSSSSTSSFTATVCNTSISDFASSGMSHYTTKRASASIFPHYSFRLYDEAEVKPLYVMKTDCINNLLLVGGYKNMQIYNWQEIGEHIVQQTNSHNIGNSKINNSDYDCDNENNLQLHFADAGNSAEGTRNKPNVLHCVTLPAIEYSNGAKSRANEINCIALDWTHENKRVFVAGGHYSIFLYDLEKQDFVTEFGGHSDYIHSLSLRNDGDVLSSGSEDGTMRLWDPRSGNMCNTIVDSLTCKYTSVTSTQRNDNAKKMDQKKHKENYVGCVEFNAENGNYLLCSSGYAKHILLWEVRMNECVDIWCGINNQQNYLANCLRFQNFEALHFGLNTNALHTFQWSNQTSFKLYNRCKLSDICNIWDIASANCSSPSLKDMLSVCGNGKHVDLIQNGQVSMSLSV